MSLAEELLAGPAQAVTPPVMQGEFIVCFSKDWQEHPTSNNHVMVELARHNRVLWLNSIGTRKPNLRSGRDLKKIWKKLLSFFSGARQVRDNLWVYTPLVLPLPHRRWATALNRFLLRLTIKRLSRQIGSARFQLWTFLPNVADYVGRLGESLSVYYCVDEWSKFNYVDGEKTAQAEQRLCQRADLVFATAKSLVARRRRWNLRTYFAPHGVDHEQFAQALHPDTIIPEDLTSLPQPVIGFYGTLQDWVDLDLICYLASRHPDWSIVLIGDALVDLSRLKEHSNIFLLGRRRHNELPRYCKGFSVGIIPYIVGERIRHVNPIKLREYLCAGLPVVSVDMPEVEPYAAHCAVAESYEEFESAIVAALREDSWQLREGRSEAMRSETWKLRVADVCRHVVRVRDSKCKSQ